MECSGRTQRREPGAAEAAPQRMDFGHGKCADDAGQDLGEHIERRAPGFSITAT